MAETQITASPQSSRKTGPVMSSRNSSSPSRLSDSDCRHSSRLPQYRISLTLGVGEIGALWAAAASKALSMPGMSLEDVLDVLGPREDPEIAECLSMLTAPGAVPGCALEDLRVERVGAPSVYRRSSARPSSILPFGDRANRSAPAAASLGIYDAGLSDAGRRVASLPKSRLN